MCTRVGFPSFLFSVTNTTLESSRKNGLCGENYSEMKVELSNGIIYSQQCKGVEHVRIIQVSFMTKCCSKILLFKRI